MPNGVLATGTSTSISSFTELMYFFVGGNNPIHPTREYSIQVLRLGSVIFDTGPIIWSRNGLDEGINLIKLVFPEAPNASLTFVVTVVGLVKGRGLRTKVYVNSLIKVSPFAKVKGKIKIGFTPKPEFFPVVSKAVDQSRSQWIVIHPLTPQRVPLLNSKAARPEPAQSNFTWVTHTYTTVNPVGTKTTSTKAKYYRTSNSVRTPGFKEKMRNGTLPVNAYSMLQQAMTYGEFRRFSQLPPPPVNTGNWSATDGSMASYLSVADIPANHLSMDENRLVAKLGEKINSVSQNIPETMAQAVQVLSLFSNNKNRIQAAYDTLKKGAQYFWTASDILEIGPDGKRRRRNSAARKRQINQRVKDIKKSTRGDPSKLLAELWLELQYGWKPLIEDVYALCKVYGEYASRNRDVITVRAVIRKRNKTATNWVNTGKLNNTPTGSVTGTKYRDTVTGVSMGITYQLDNQAVNTLAQLGFTSPAGLAWELTPFSFVLDWFLPIGRALDVLRTFDGLTFKKGYKTYLTKESLSAKMYYSGLDGVYTTTLSGHAFGEAVRMSRTVLTDFPSPTLPRFKNPVSAIHAANAAALIKVLSKR